MENTSTVKNLKKWKTICLAEMHFSSLKNLAQIIDMFISVCISSRVTIFFMGYGVPNF